MTKEDAIVVMLLGKKVKHKFFDDHEWIATNGINIITEDGFSYLPNDFWKFRRASSWESGWSIVE